jgi:hypothetical protein
MECSEPCSRHAVRASPFGHGGVGGGGGGVAGVGAGVVAAAAAAGGGGAVTTLSPGIRTRKYGYENKKIRMLEQENTGISTRKYGYSNKKMRILEQEKTGIRTRKYRADLVETLQQPGFLDGSFRENGLQHGGRDYVHEISAGDDQHLVL